MWKAKHASTWAALLCGALAFFAPHFSFFERLELQTHDLRFAWRGPRKSTARVVVVAIDDDTVAAWSGTPTAFWGNHYAALLQNARIAGVREVGMDIIPAVQGEEYLQNTVSSAIEAARAKTKVDELSDAEIEAVLTAPELRPDRALREAVEKANGRVLLADSFADENLLVPDLQTLGGITQRPYIGFVDLPPQWDDAIRVEALFAQAAPGGKGVVRPSFAALIAARAMNDLRRGNTPYQPDQGEDLRRLIQNGTGSLSEDGFMATFWINPVGGAEEGIPVISAVRLADAPQTLSAREHASLQGAIVVVGATEGLANGDVYRAPGGHQPDVPGVVFHAQAIATLVDGAALTRLAWWHEGVVALCFVFFWILLARAANMPFLPGLMAAALMAVLWSAFCYWRFCAAHYLLPVAVPVLFVVFCALLTYGLESVEEASARKRVEQIFGRNVSPAIRDYLVEQGVGALGQGTVGVASVLFFDVRGSTAYAEHRAPEAVIAALNALFADIVPLVEEQGGLINRFTGDGFLAIFGVPEPTHDHARTATETALRIADLIESRQAGEIAADAQLSGGCGVHTGPVVYGYLGAKKRAEFTVIGDTVNVAARLEALNKPLGTRVVLSDVTAEQLPSALLGRLCGPIEQSISGRAAKTKIFTA